MDKKKKNLEKKNRQKVKRGALTCSEKKETPRGAKKSALPEGSELERRK